MSFFQLAVFALQKLQLKHGNTRTRLRGGDPWRVGGYPTKRGVMKGAGRGILNGEIAIADSSSNQAVYAGGLAGYITNTASSVERCFAASAVTAQSAGSGAVYAGGVVGYKASGTLSHNAALGGAVTVKGSGTKTAARVYAYPASGGGTTNYALDTMRIEKSSAYGSYYFPYWDGTNSELSPAYYRVSSSTNAADPDGSSAAASAFRNSGFWTTTLGFSATEWDFGGVVGRGYPKLAWQ
jgi:hypothetical protein